MVNFLSSSKKKSTYSGGGRFRIITFHAKTNNNSTAWPLDILVFITYQLIFIVVAYFNLRNEHKSFGGAKQYLNVHEDREKERI